MPNFEGIKLPVLLLGSLKNVLAYDFQADYWKSGAILFFLCIQTNLYLMTLIALLCPNVLFLVRAHFHPLYQVLGGIFQFENFVL